MRDAKRYAAQIETDLARGDYVDPQAGNITLRDFYVDWKQRQLWTSNTTRNSERAMNRADFAVMPLIKIRRTHVEAWLKDISVDYMPTPQRNLYNMNILTLLYTVTGSS